MLFHHRAVMEKGLYSFGLLVMVDGILILAIVMDTQTAFSHCQYPAPHKEGKFTASKLYLH